MKAVVIGGKGHIGTYLCPMLVKNGFEVVSITRGNSQPYEDDYAWKDVESVFLDRNKCSNFEEQVISMNPDIIIDLVNFNIEDTKKMVEAIKKSNAKKVYIPNVMTQPGETEGYNVLDHVQAIIKHTEPGLIDCIVTNNEKISESVARRYNDDGSTQVLFDNEQRLKLKCMGIKAVESNLIEVKDNYIRHNADEISSIIIKLALGHDM